MRIAHNINSYRKISNLNITKQYLSASYLQNFLKSMIFLSLLQIFDLNAKIPDIHAETYKNMKSELIQRDIPEQWIMKNIHNKNFVIYENITRFFTNMAEHRVKRNEKDVDWYMNHFGVRQKVISGKNFMRKYERTLNKAEEKYGIPKELVTAILAIESNFGDSIFKGTFYTFPALVSQYLLLENRRNFAVNQIEALYQFEKKTGHDTYYFIGSFAGASGWGQFIPSSLLIFFTTENENFSMIDIYDLENNIFSIANYINKNGLSNYNRENTEDLYKAIYNYNRSDAYVRAVLYIYNGLLN